MGTITVRDAVYAFLADQGIDTIFGNPGSTELPMFRDMPPSIRYVLGLQEGVVAGMADGHAQATGLPALLNLHSSAGVGHALGNIHTAYRNRTPMVIVAGQQARSILPFEPFLFAERPTEFPQPFVKWAVEPARAEDVPLAIARAFHVAMQPPRGPVFVSVPVDDWDRPSTLLAPRRVSTRLDADPGLLTEAGAMLARAERPVIVAGSGVGRSGAGAALAHLASLHQAPVWAAPFAARETIDENHPLFAGFLPAAREPIVAALSGHDLVLVIGAPVFTWHVEGFGPAVPPGAALVLIDDDPDFAARVPQGLAITGDIPAAIERLTATRAPDRGPPAPRPSYPAPAGGSITSDLLIARLQALRPHGIAIAEEAPSSRPALHRHFRVGPGDTFHACASGGLGFALPAAAGLAVAGRPTLALIGDGSMMYSIQTLWSAARYALDLRVIVVNNCGYAALDQFGEQFGVQGAETALPGLDFCALAQGHGLPAARVSDPAGLDEALVALFARTGPSLLEVMVAR
ncbi:benzoylformate decarboxylase [Sphingomonas canadensis]|uniref:Benzoylformate decarboxylase n=1 Tax=Sphingomonas canadensis TaxID=1219257 RepID=A0ABW3H6W9_9SPHN|nr:benzoylformate decarboxylase [Sphingomonas canadensis]MCW3835640.1 benzoylformate decarboxylase [Sphingomonas canadensis]